MNFLAVNYHYVGDEEEYTQGIYPVSRERLAAQIDLLGETYHFVSGQEVKDALGGVRTLPEYSCLLTFDDGLRCHREALSVLDQKGVPGMFFVATLPYSEGEVLLVHKIHWLLANLEPSVFKEEVIASLAQQHVAVDIPSLTAFSSVKYRYDLPETAVLKYLLNAYLPHPVRASIVDSIFTRYVEDSASFVRQWYLSADDLAVFGARGYVGMHSHDHMPLVGEDAAVEEGLRINKEILERLSAQKMYAVSYPYGAKVDIKASVPALVAKLGLSFGLTMERAFNTTLTEPFLFARADTNDAPGGKKPVLKVSAGIPEIIGTFAPKRTLFCTE